LHIPHRSVNVGWEQGDECCEDGANRLPLCFKDPAEISVMLEDKSHGWNRDVCVNIGVGRPVDEVQRALKVFENCGRGNQNLTAIIDGEAIAGFWVFGLGRPAVNEPEVLANLCSRPPLH
jgi:hypothetical protein